MARENKKKNSHAAAITGLCLLIVGLAIIVFVGLPWVSRMRYSLEYPDQIRRYAAEFRLDPYLVASVIHCESGNRSGAQSEKGAVGLMQIMPETGEWIAQKLDITDYCEEMLRDPDTNIRFGCWYLNFLMERFDSDTRTVLAAYNAGHGIVKKWLEDEQYSKDGELVTIPYAQTRDYVEKVQRTYEKYRKLYPNELAVAGAAA